MVKHFTNCLSSIWSQDSFLMLSGNLSYASANDLVFTGWSLSVKQSDSISPCEKMYLSSLLKSLYFYGFVGCSHSTVLNRDSSMVFHDRQSAASFLLREMCFTCRWYSSNNNLHLDIRCVKTLSYKKIEVIGMVHEIGSSNHSFKCFHSFDYSQQLFFTDGAIELSRVQFVRIKAKRSSFLYQCCKLYITYIRV